MAAQPPPLKARSKRKAPSAPPLPKSKSRVIEDAIDALEAVPPVEEPEPVEDDPAEGEWLFKEDDMVKGPVPAELLVKGIADGVLDAKTKIAREMGKWIPLGEVGYFAHALAEAAERKRVEAELARIKALKSRRFAIRAAVFVLILFVPSIAGAVVGRQVMILKPWDDSEEWIQRAPPLVELPKPPPKFAKVEEPPPPAPNEDGKPEDGTGDEGATVDDDDKKASKDKKRSRRSRRGKKAKDKKSKKDEAKDTKVAEAEPAKEAVTSSKDLPRTLSTAQVMKGLNKGAGGFKRCVKAEMDRNPDIPARITLAFSVANDGTAINVKLLERQVRSGPLASCIQKSMQKLRWPKFYGERPYAEVPFNISKPKEKPALRKKPE